MKGRNLDLIQLYIFPVFWCLSKCWTRYFWRAPLYQIWKNTKTLVFPVPTRERFLEHLGCHVWRWPCVRLKEYDRSGVLLVARCISGRSVREVRNIWCPVVQLWNQQGVFHYICHHSVRSLDCKNGFVNRSDWPQNIARRIGLSHYTIWIAYHWEI